MPETNAFFAGNEVNAVDGARLNTQVASCAFVGDDSMHHFGSAEDGIDWAGLNTFCAANTFILTNPSDHGLFFNAVFSIEGLGLDIQQVS
jgi:hypothetical protein